MSRVRPGSGVLAILIIGLLAAGPTLAEAKQKRKSPRRAERTLEYKYDTPTIGGLCTPGSCVSVPLNRKDRYAEVEIDDMTGTSTAFVALQPGNGGFFCGRTGQFRLNGYESLEIGVMALSVLCPGALGTSGTITVTLSNLP